MTANWSDVGLSASQSADVHDMWSHADLGDSTGSFTTTLPAYGSRLLKLAPGVGATTYHADASGNAVAAASAMRRSRALPRRMSITMLRHVPKT